MGSAIIAVCGNTDFFQDLLQKYGEMFIKLVVSQKMKMELEENFPLIIAKIKNYVDLFVKKVNEIVDSKIRELNEIFQELKQNIEEMFPGRIQELERKRGVSINQFIGFNDCLLKIDEIRDKSLEEVQQQHVQVEKDLIVKKAELYKQIQEQRPKVPIYDHLQEKTRWKVLKRAETEFASRIQEGQKKIQEKCDQNFGENFSKLNGVFIQIIPENFLDDFIKKSANEMFRNLAQDSGCGKFGGCLFDMC